MGILRTRRAVPGPTRRRAYGGDMGQLVQIAGSLCVLAGFALAQWGVLNPKSLTYLILNTVGSAVLAVNAVTGRQWGFLLLEGVWAIVSAVSLVQVLRRGPTRPDFVRRESAPRRRDGQP
jgi:hypothetical protein